MALAFDSYGRVVEPGRSYTQLDDLELQRKQASKDKRYADASAIYGQMQKLKAAADPNSPETQAKVAWDKAQELFLREGPLNAGVQQQMVNRRADQSAAAEAVNAEEIRNMAAARGLDPTQALRQAQQQRQAQNLAFSGDLRSQAAVQNFAAETPGRMAAAQANLQRQFGATRTPAVQGNSAPSLAFSGQPSAASRSSGPIIPQVIQNPGAGQYVPTRTFGAPTGTTPAPAPAPAPKPAPIPGGSGSGWVQLSGQPATRITTQPANKPITMTPTQSKSLLNSLNSAVPAPLPQPNRLTLKQGRPAFTFGD